MLVEVERLVTLAIVFNEGNTIGNSLQYDGASIIYDSAFNTVQIQSKFSSNIIPDMFVDSVPGTVYTTLQSVHKTFFGNYSRIAKGNEVLDTFTQLMVKRSAYLSRGWDVIHVKVTDAIVFRSLQTDEHYILFKRSSEVFASKGYTITTFSEACSLEDVDTTVIVAGVELVPIPTKIRRLTDVCLKSGYLNTNNILVYTAGDFTLCYDKVLTIQFNKSKIVCTDVTTLNATDIYNLEAAYNTLQKHFTRPIIQSEELGKLLCGVLDDNGEADNYTTIATLNGVQVIGISDTNDIFLCMQINGLPRTVLYEGKSCTAYNYEYAALEDLKQMQELLALPPVHSFSDAVARYFDVCGLENNLDNIELLLKLCGVNTTKVANIIIDDLLH